MDASQNAKLWEIDVSDGSDGGRWRTMRTLE